jgi:diguanylate cyclase (GGDEF)-like protein
MPMAVRLVTVLASRLRRALDRERTLARTDFLTGIANRTAFHEMVGREIERQRRYRRPFGLAYIDCDNFKAVNDSLGHHAGDDLLRSIGAVLGAGLRRTDVVARLGGDEFAVGWQREDAAASLLTQLKASRRTPILPANSGRNR